MTDNITGLVTDNVAGPQPREKHMNEQYAEIRKAAMALAFEQWWAQRYPDVSPEWLAHLDAHKAIAKAAWQARDEQVMALSDLVQELLKERKVEQ